MQSDIYNDITAINIQLNELRSKFDQAMRGGNDVSEIKETYMQIKELECLLNALEWDPEKQIVGHHTSANAWS